MAPQPLATRKKTEAFNDFFCSVFTIERKTNTQSVEEQPYDYPLGSVIITPEKVMQKLKRLKKNKSVGPDGFHSRVLWECADSIKVPLALIFNKSLS